MTSENPNDREDAMVQNRNDREDAMVQNRDDREDAMVQKWMQEFAALPLPESRLPEAQLLWWKAELLRRWDEERKAIAPIERAEPINVSIAVVGALVLMLTLWQSSPGPTATLIFATVVGVTALVAVTAFTLRRL